MTQQLLIACKKCHRQFDVTGMAKGDKLRCQCGELMKVPEMQARDARMVHCSACGGKLTPGAKTCEYCGGTVSMADRNMGAACPECFARLPAGARFCSECGTRIDPTTLRTVKASAVCPRCKGGLVLREFPQGHYTECTGCGGIWLDADSFNEVVQKKDAEVLGTAITRSKEDAGAAKPRKNVENKVKYVPCPVCGKLMNRKNFAGCSGVIIDWCKGHGFWFDAYELEKIIAFIKEGGLDKSRDMEIQRAKREIDRLRERRRTVSTGSSMGNSGGWSPLDDGSSQPIFDLGDALSSLFRVFFR